MSRLRVCVITDLFDSYPSARQALFLFLPLRTVDHKLASKETIRQRETIFGKYEPIIITQTQVTKDGKPLNLNFEKGDLEDWSADGEAFTDPILNSDPSPLHGEANNILFEEKNFLSSGGTKNYSPTGTLTSPKPLHLHIL